MFKKIGSRQTCAQLLEKYHKMVSKPRHPEKLMFDGVGEKDVYNTTAPFFDDGELVIAGRVESRDNEYSQVYFFVEKNGKWVPRTNAPIFSLQDPFVTKIGGEMVFGGVQIFPHPVHKGQFGWRTVFYRGKRIAELKEFAKGPEGMKDIRLVEIGKDRIGIFTRPQGEKGGRGTIGYTEISRLEQLTAEVIEQAELLEGQFIEEEWGGANELHRLQDGTIGVLGHIACFDDKGDRHYYPMVFLFDPDTRQFSDLRIIATRSDFIDGPAKRPDLKDVVFSGGLIRKEDGTAELYCGTSDAETQKITIPDPFL
ncbi:MTP-1 family protein [Fervidibacillus halotolerans]|uniref:DUF1861 family protein n=1 Tax=Fervidibacillus halotolerans TaxID=2980027 RepID=A0A9E8RYT8_9BACI|nr:DUF1861 family protein [Fervidibacillus halotolerans]WAA13171.1 DUF1861 family protein [Fervidibacillus halotolerans]